MMKWITWGKHKQKSIISCQKLKINSGVRTSKSRAVCDLKKHVCEFRMTFVWVSLVKGYIRLKGIVSLKIYIYIIIFFFPMSSGLWWLREDLQLRCWNVALCTSNLQKINVESRLGGEGRRWRKSFQHSPSLRYSWDSHGSVPHRKADERSVIHTHKKVFFFKPGSTDDGVKKKKESKKTP